MAVPRHPVQMCGSCPGPEGGQAPDLPGERPGLRVVQAEGTVSWVLDLPSRGDTSLVAAVHEPDGSLLVADYTSPESVGDVMWLRGQLNPTEIHLYRLGHP